MEKSLKKIRKKQEACFGKDLQIMRNSFFRPNTYTHFKTGIILYQKIDLICKSSKFKKIVFKEFKEEINEGLELLHLNENKILEIKHSWEISQLWTRLKPFRSDAKKWYELILETEKYNLPPNSDKETVKKARLEVWGF